MNKASKDFQASAILTGFLLPLLLQRHDNSLLCNSDLNKGNAHHLSRHPFTLFVGCILACHGKHVRYRQVPPLNSLPPSSAAAGAHPPLPAKTTLHTQARTPHSLSLSFFCCWGTSASSSATANRATLKELPAREPIWRLSVRPVRICM